MTSKMAKAIRVALGIGVLGSAYLVGRASATPTQEEVVNVVETQARENPASCGQTALAVLQKSLTECPTEITAGLAQLYQSNTAQAQDFSQRLQSVNIDAYNAVFGSMPAPDGMPRAIDIEVRDNLSQAGRYVSLVDRITNAEYGISSHSLFGRRILSIGPINTEKQQSAPLPDAPSSLAPLPLPAQTQGQSQSYTPPSSATAQPMPSASAPTGSAPTGFVGNSLQKIVQGYDGVRSFIRQR